jgi:hypothetical protein
MDIGDKIELKIEHGLFVNDGEVYTVTCVSPMNSLEEYYGVVTASTGEVVLIRFGQALDGGWYGEGIDLASDILRAAENMITLDLVKDKQINL